MLVRAPFIARRPPRWRWLRRASSPTRISACNQLSFLAIEPVTAWHGTRDDLGGNTEQSGSDRRAAGARRRDATRPATRPAVAVHGRVLVRPVDPRPAPADRDPDRAGGGAD